MEIAELWGQLRAADYPIVQCSPVRQRRRRSLQPEQPLCKIDGQSLAQIGEAVVSGASPIEKRRSYLHC